MNKTQRNTQSNLPIKYGNFVQIFNQAEPILVQTTKRILLFHYLSFSFALIFIMPKIFLNV